MHGKLSLSFLKVMAVVSALAIGGGYVAWRQSEAEKANERERIEQAKAEKELELIVGSKNPVRKMLTDEEMDDYLQKGKDFIETIPGIPEASGEVVNEAPLLSGSKSMSMPLFTKDQIRELPALEEQEDRELLPSSKIGILKLPQKEDEPSKKNDPKLLPSSKSIDWILDNPNRKKSE